MKIKIVIVIISALLLGFIIFRYIQNRENKIQGSEISVLNSQISDLEDEKSALEVRIVGLKEARENLQSNIEEARDRANGLKNQNDDNEADRWNVESKAGDVDENLDEMEENTDN